MSIVTTKHQDISLTQEYILRSLSQPRADFEIEEIYRKFKYSPRVAPSTIRTARAGLVKLGYVKEYDELRKTDHGRTAKTWVKTRG